LEKKKSNRKVIDFGPHSFLYCIQTPWKKRRIHSFYYKAGLDLAGNIAGLADSTNLGKGDTIKVS
jgi:hypothetical protein